MPAPVYDPILDAEINPEEPVTSSLKYRLRDNTLAIAGGDSAAPHLAPNRIDSFITAGIHAWTVPAGVYRAKFTGIGGGGSGGNNDNEAQTGGGGGGSGAYFIAVLTVSPGEQFEWSIGAGGAAQSADGTAGNNGEMTFFRLVGDASADWLRAGGGVGGPVYIPGGAGGTAYVAGAEAAPRVVGNALVGPGMAGWRGHAGGGAASGGAGGSSLLGRGGPEIGAAAAANAGVFGGGGSGNRGEGVDSGAGGTGIGIIEY